MHYLPVLAMLSLAAAGMLPPSCESPSAKTSAAATPRVAVLCALSVPAVCTQTALEDAVTTLLAGTGEPPVIDLWLAEHDQPARMVASTGVYVPPRAGGPRALARARTEWAGSEASKLARGVEARLARSRHGPQQLVEAIAAAAASKPSSILVISNGLERSSYADMACKRIRPQSFARAVTERALPRESAIGVKVHFTQYAPRPLHRRGCAATMKVWRDAQAAWRAALSLAGMEASFYSGAIPASAFESTPEQAKEEP